VNANDLSDLLAFAGTFVDMCLPKYLRGIMLDKTVVVAAHSKSYLELSVL